MTAPVNWGVPDWLDATAYPSPVGRGQMLIWAWEFLRRNYQYRKFWSDKVRKRFDENGNEIWTIDQLYEEAKAIFGLERCINDPSSPSTPLLHYVTARRVISERDIEIYQLGSISGEIAYIFDLSMPLEGQFEAARRDANAMQSLYREKYNLVDEKSRVRGDMYRCYLRILDAYESGADGETIGETLLPGLPNVYPDFQRSRNLRDRRKAAEKLRDEGYRRLARISQTPLCIGAANQR